MFKDKIVSEYNSFKREYEHMSPTEVYDDWYKIGFYEEYSTLFLSSTFMKDEYYAPIRQWLDTFEYPILFLYNEWLKQDGAFSHDWNSMIEFMKYLYEFYEEDLNNE